MSRFLVRPKACHEKFRTVGRLAYPEQNVLWTYYYPCSRGHSLEITHPSRPAAKELWLVWAISLSQT